MLVCPSIVAERGLERILSDAGDFSVNGIFTDISDEVGNRIVTGFDSDLVILDPCVLGLKNRRNARAALAGLTDAPVVAFTTEACDDEVLRQFDGAISLFDSPSTIARKLRGVISAREAAGKSEGGELSAREKEILVSVAKGMINKDS